MKQKFKTSKDNSNKSRLLMALIIIFLMVFSVLGFVVVRETEGERIQYKQKTFSKANDKWLTYIDNKPLVISSSPKDLEQIQTPKVFLNDLNSAQKIYISKNYKETANYMQIELFGNLQQFLNTPLINSCSEENEQCPNIPIKTCKDATVQQKVILFKQSQEQEIFYTENCLIIQGNNQEITKKIDKLLLNILIG